MKKYIASFLVMIICCAIFVACASEKNDGTQKNEETTALSQPKETEAESETETITETEELPEEEKPLGYIAPEGWYVPRFETGKVDGGDYDLVPEVMGLKVYYVQKYFEMSPTRWGYYRDETISNVMWFQEENYLVSTGEVDLATWMAMGYSEEAWNDLGSYVTPVKIKREYTRDQIIRVFVDTAREYLATPYVVGAAGKPGEGVDCSGLVLQCMYAIGVYPDGLDPVQHSTVEEYNSRLMWADPKLKEVSYDELSEGDLVFYRRTWSSRVCHVAIYVGENECIEALNAEVELLPLQKEDDDYIVMGYKRVIAD